MCRIILTALLIAAPSHATGLDALDFLAGNCWSAAGDAGQTETHCYRFIHGDRFVEDSLMVSAEGGPAYQGTTIYRADPEGAIRWVYYGDRGGWMEGRLEPVDGGFDMPPAACVGPDGNTLTMRVRWRGIEVDAFEAETETWIDDAWVLTSRRVFARGEPSESPAGTVVFKSRRDGDDELYRWDDGTITRLTTAPGADHWPSPSPDGRQLVWFRVEDGIRNLYIGSMTENGLVDRHPFLPSAGQDLLPAWSPTGDRIAFFSSRDEGGIGPEGLFGHLYIAAPDGSELQRVTTQAVESTAISWRPDGGAIAFAAAGRIQVAELASGVITELAIDGYGDARAGHPAWSPDGRWVAFHAHSDDGAGLYRVPAEGGKAVPIATGPGFRYAPAWSADGRWVIYTGSQDGADYGLYAVLATGGGDQPISDSPADDRLGAWLPKRR